MRGTLKSNLHEIQSLWSVTNWEAMSICFLYLRTYKNIYVHAEIKGKKINIIVFSFQIYSHCHLLTYNSFIWNNERLLGIFGSRLSAQALNPQPFFLLFSFSCYLYPGNKLSMSWNLLGCTDLLVWCHQL